jgi:glycerol-3-phosphate cytidylyltransferase
VRFLKNAKENGPTILREQLLALGMSKDLVPEEGRKVLLVVGIHADVEVAKYKRTPVMNMEEREEVVAACRYVDETILGAPLRVTPEYLQEHKIDAVCHAHLEEEDDRYRFMYEAVPDGHFIRLMPSPVSTTDVIARVQQRTYDNTLADETGSSASEDDRKAKK